MCIICDGASEDEVLQAIHVKIGHYGYTMTMVEAEPPWTYTIGLATRPHPELVTTGLGAEPSAAVISAVAARIRNGARFDKCSDPLDLDGLVVRFGPVHDEQ